MITPDCCGYRVFFVQYLLVVDDIVSSLFVFFFLWFVGTESTLDWLTLPENKFSKFVCMQCRRHNKFQHPKSALLCTLIRIGWLVLSSVKLMFFVEDLRMASKVIYKWILLPCLGNYATRAQARRCWLKMQKKL